MKPSERIAQIARLKVDVEMERWRKERSDKNRKATAFLGAITGTDVTDAAFAEARLAYPSLWLNRTKRRI